MYTHLYIGARGRREEMQVYIHAYISRGVYNATGYYVGKSDGKRIQLY